MKTVPLESMRHCPKVQRDILPSDLHMAAYHAKIGTQASPDSLNARHVATGGFIPFDCWFKFHGVKF